MATTNERTNVKLFPTAIASDVLFFVQISSTLPKNKGVAYGAAYRTCLPNAVENFPNHQLVYITPADEQGYQKWYFAADRVNQDEYNWQIDSSSQLVRAYLIRRTLYFGRSDTEAAEINPPVTGEFTRPEASTADTRFPKYKFIDDTVLEAPDELKSLYVVIRRRYAEPLKQRRSKGVPNLTPQKFRRQITTSTTTTSEPLTTAEANSIPVPADPVFPQTVIEHQKVNDHRYEKVITTEVIAENADPLVGQIFAPDGVLLSTSEALVVEGTAADAAFLVEYSSSDPTGDGKAVKSSRTPRRRNTDGTTVAGWPKKQTKSKGAPSLIPSKFKRFATTVRTTTQVTLPQANVDDLPAVADLTEGQTLIEHSKVNDYRYEQSITAEALDLETDPLEGELMNRYGTISTTTESLVADSESLPELTYLTLGSSDSPLGNGISVRQIETVTSFPLLTGYESDRRLNISTKYTEQVIDATIPVDEEFEPNPLIEYRPIDALRTLKRETVAPNTALDEYVLSYPTRVSLDLPRELLSVTVTWNESHSIGTQDFAFLRVATGPTYSLGGNGSDSASSFASITADLQIRYKDFATGNLMGIRYLFYVEQASATEAGILAKLATLTEVSVSMWPVFMPESQTITVDAQAVRVQANTSIGMNSSRRDGDLVAYGSEAAQSDDYSVNLSSNSVQIPPCIHGGISLTGITEKNRTVAATAFMQITHGDFASPIIATKTKSGTAYGKVTPTSLPATGGASAVPVSGLFVVDMDASPYEYGYVQVACTLFDASVLAP